MHDAFLLNFFLRRFSFFRRVLVSTSLTYPYGLIQDYV